MRSLKHTYTQFIFFSLTVLSLTSIAHLPVRGQNSLLVIRGGAVVDVVKGQILQDQDVFIQNSKIKKISTRGKLHIPPSAKIIEAEGQYLIPGLIDMHVHYMDWVPELTVNHGVTSVRDMANQITWILALKRSQEIGLLDLQGVDWFSRTGPRILVAGVINTHPNGQSHHYQATSTGDALKAVDWMLAAGADAGLKLHMGISLEHLQAICKKANTLGIRVSSHLPPTIPVRKAISSGLDGLEHSADLPKQTESQALSTIQTMINQNVYWTPTLLNKWKDVVEITPEDAQYIDSILNEPGLAYLPEMKRKVLKVLHPLGGRAQLQKGERAQQFKFLFRLIKAYVDGGGKLLAGSDTPSHFLSGFALHQEMALFVDQVGMTPLQALQTATVNAADYLQRTDLGRLEVGTQADIVLLEKNPLTNIRNTRTISTVILGGKAVSMTYHANFLPLIMRPIMPHSKVFYGQELLEKE